MYLIAVTLAARPYGPQLTSRKTTESRLLGLLVPTQHQRVTRCWAI